MSKKQDAPGEFRYMPSRLRGRAATLPKNVWARIRFTILATLTNLFVIIAEAIVTKGLDGPVDEDQSRETWAGGVIVDNSPDSAARWC